MRQGQNIDSNIYEKKKNNRVNLAYMFESLRGIFCFKKTSSFELKKIFSGEVRESV